MLYPWYRWEFTNSILILDCWIDWPADNWRKQFLRSYWTKDSPNGSWKRRKSSTTPSKSLVKTLYRTVKHKLGGNLITVARLQTSEPYTIFRSSMKKIWKLCMKDWNGSESNERRNTLNFKWISPSSKRNTRLICKLSLLHLIVLASHFAIKTW